MMPEHFDLEKYVRDAIVGYPAVLDVLRRSKAPMLDVAVNLHKDLLKLGNDWSGVHIGMLMMYVFLTYCNEKEIEKLVYIS